MTMVTAMTQYTTTLSYAAIGEVVNNEVIIMPMIETRDGVENVEYVPKYSAKVDAVTDSK